MSLLNSLSGLGSGLSSFAGLALKDEAAQRVPLLNQVAPVENKTEKPQDIGLNVPIGDSTATGNKLDPDTIARAHQVYQGLVARGMDPATAIGFAANAVQESRANPATGAGDMGASHGLMQWRDDRYNGFMNKFGNSTKLDDHLDYIMHEVGGPEAKAWQAIQAAEATPAAKAGAVSQFYERPRDVDAEIARRGYIANALAGHFAQFANGGG